MTSSCMCTRSLSSTNCITWLKRSVHRRREGEGLSSVPYQKQRVLLKVEERRKDRMATKSRLQGRKQRETCVAQPIEHIARGHVDGPDLLHQGGPKTGLPNRRPRANPTVVPPLLCLLSRLHIQQEGFSQLRPNCLNALLVTEDHFRDKRRAMQQATGMLTCVLPDTSPSIMHDPNRLQCRLASPGVDVIVGAVQVTCSQYLLPLSRLLRSAAPPLATV